MRYSQKENFVEPGKEAKILGLHKKILGRTLTTVDISGQGLYIRVLPTHTLGILPLGADDLVWATIWWNGQKYIVDLHNEKLSGASEWHIFSSLNGALRRARTAVGRDAAMCEQPFSGWTYVLHERTPDLQSVEPSDSERAWSAQLRRMAEEDIRADIEEGFDLFDGYRYGFNDSFDYGD